MKYHLNPQFFLFSLIYIKNRESLKQIAIVSRIQMSQYLFLLVVGILSTITCALILLCLNSNKQVPLVQNPQSPISQKGMPQKQKRIILTIVFGIFFMSMILTSYKAGKYDYWFSGCATVQLVQSVKSFSITNDKKDKFIGLNNGDCTLQEKQISPQNQQQYQQLSQLRKMIENIKSDVMKRSFVNTYPKQQQPQTYQVNDTTINNHEQQLSIFVSNVKSQLTQKNLHHLSSHICGMQYSGSNPTLYIDLEEEYLTSSALLKYKFGYPSYQHLKETICQINGIKLRKQTLFSGQIIQSYVKKSSQQSSSNRAYLIVNNFQNMLNTILDEAIAVQQQKVQYYSHNNNNQRAEKRNLQKSYSFFLEKMFNQLIEQCELNVVLYTKDSTAIQKLQKRWRLFSLNAQVNTSITYSQNKPHNNNKFPFIVKHFQSISQSQFLEILKIKWSQYSLNQQQLTRLFNGYFINLRSNPNMFKQQSNTFNQQNEQLKQDQINKYLVKLEEYLKRIQQPKQTESFYRQKSHSKSKHSNYQSQMNSVAKFHNVLEPYRKLKSLNSHSILISYAKKMITLKQINKMEEIGIITVNQGRVKLN